MTSLLSLPDDILAEILSHLEPAAPTIKGPWFQWESILEASSNATREDLCVVRALTYTCRHLYTQAKKVLHRHALLEDRRSLSSFSQALERSDELGSRIRSAHVKAMEGFERLFWLPNIESLSIANFNNTDSFERQDQNRTGTSTVRDLRLVSCGAYEAALADMLSWPAALKELWFDIDDGYWYCCGPFEPITCCSCAAVVRCMDQQRNHLKKLVLTRQPPVDVGVGYDLGPTMDLSRYDQLTDLCIQHVWLCGLEPGNGDVRDRLPRNIVTLEIYYDDHEYRPLFWNETDCPDWLLDMLRNKRRSTPRLQQVRIASLGCGPHEDEEEDEEEKEDEDESDADLDWSESATPPVTNKVNPHTDHVEGVSHPIHSWKPPRNLTAAFVRAKVSFSIFLNYERRFRHIIKGAKDFDESWEDWAEFWHTNEEYSYD